MVESLIRQMHWANTQVIAWLGDQAGDTAWITGQLSHILRAEGIWLERAHGRIHPERNTFVPYFRNQMPGLNDANRDGWLAQVRQGRLDREIDYHLFDGSPARTSLQDIILHVSTHGFHHRGQIAARITAMGLPQPPTTFITYTRLPK